MGTRQQEKTWEYLREIGRPSLLKPDTPEVQWALRKLRSYNSRGMSLSAMADQVGLVQDAITRLLRKDRPSLRRSTFEKIRQIEFDPGSQTGQVPVHGAQRRLRALRAQGFTYTFLCDQFGHAHNSPRLQRILTGFKEPGRPVKFLISSTARQIEELYDKLDGVDPLDLGITEHGVKYSLRRARELGYAPRSCWDEDTIDDPEAIPEWTGRCGSALGFRIHLREGIPVCEACAGHETSEPYPGFNGILLRRLRERKGLSRQQLATAVGGLNASTIQYWESGRSKPVRQFKLDGVLSVLDATLEDVCE